MVTVRLGNTGVIANKNGFGALPIQRIDVDSAVKLIRMALVLAFNKYTAPGEREARVMPMRSMWHRSGR